MSARRELKVVVNEGDIFEFNKKVAEVTLDIFKKICPEEFQLEAINKFQIQYETSNNQRSIY